MDHRFFLIALMSVTDHPSLLFVVGMHRSGTSALCAALNACGIEFGSQLLRPMAGVNDEGFWEHAELVAVNEDLLAGMDGSWYAPPGITVFDARSVRQYDALRERARGIISDCLQYSGPPAVKDPRLCLTLPFWLSLCEEMGLTPRVCVIHRAPLEVARSLARRDGFPLAYGLRLCASYRRAVEQFVPQDGIELTYDELLSDTHAAVRRLAGRMPELMLDDDLADRLQKIVRTDLRHQRVDDVNAMDSTGLTVSTDAENMPGRTGSKQQWAVLADPLASAAALEAAIACCFPVEDCLRQMARQHVASTQELSHVGELHTRALATIAQRDADIGQLAAEHNQALATIGLRDVQIQELSALHEEALATIALRDQQIQEFDERLAQLGAEHSHALAVIEERDAQLAGLNAQLEYLYSLPAVGRVLRRLNRSA